MENVKHKFIFISPIDWGIGHSCRCVPIIEELIKTNDVIIGITPINEAIFNHYFPTLQKLQVPSYNIRYSKHLPVWLKILLQYFKIKKVIRNEHVLLKQIVANHNINLIISDNRFGLYHKHVESIFITHQLNIKAPFFSSIATKINKHFICKFNLIWVPDYENENSRLAGELSKSTETSMPISYIGPKSALNRLNPNGLEAPQIDYLILLSGIEPQRSILEQKLISKFESINKKVVLIRGTTHKLNTTSTNIKTYDFLVDLELKQFILSSKTIICRSGYSTLMDMHCLKKTNLILIPTPGQTEQEYLAKYWQLKFGAEVWEQKNISNYYLNKS